MKTFIDFISSKTFIRILTFLIIILTLYVLRGMMNIILFTFIFIILMGNIQSFITNAVEKYISVNRKLIIIILYLLIVLFLALISYKYLPIITNQLSELVNRIYKFYKYPPNNVVVQYIINALNQKIDLNKMNLNWTAVVNYLTNIWQAVLQIFISILLSLFYLLSKDHVVKFTASFKNSLLSRFFVEVEYFSLTFTNSFGKVIEVQFLIAFINASLTTFVLWILHFPQLLGLWLMIFFLGLIPVAGVFISLIPLCIIAYSIGGGIKILYVLILILCVHALESYVLNPKLMSVKTHVPVFYTFIVLLIAEHFMGIWGLILGIPIFIFLLDIIGVNYQRKRRKNT